MQIQMQNVPPMQRALRNRTWSRLPVWLGTFALQKMQGYGVFPVRHGSVGARPHTHSFPWALVTAERVRGMMERGRAPYGAGTAMRAGGSSCARTPGPIARVANSIVGMHRTSGLSSKVKGPVPEVKDLALKSQRSRSQKPMVPRS